MKTVEQYAIELLCSGAESTAEDDMNEDGEIEESEHEIAVNLVLSLVRAIRQNPLQLIALVAAEGQTAAEHWTPSDLDRCPHGRHSVDNCFSCPDRWSAGNPYLRSGQRIGTNYGGQPILAPEQPRERTTEGKQ